MRVGVGCVCSLPYAGSASAGRIVGLESGKTSSQVAYQGVYQQMMAGRMALDEGLGFMSPAFDARVLDLVRNPTDAMTAQAKMAGDRGVFTEVVPGGLGESLLKITDEHKWMKIILPFITTPSSNSMPQVP